MFLYKYTRINIYKIREMSPKKQISKKFLVFIPCICLEIVSKFLISINQNALLLV